LSVSFDLGGEKLKLSQARLGALLAAFLLLASPLIAQTSGNIPGPGAAAASESTVPAGGELPSGSELPDESTLLIGAAPPAPVTPGGSSIFVVIRMVLVLALAAVAIYGVVFFIKRLNRPQVSRDPHLKVLARAPLGSDSFAAVVSVGAKAWLVAGGSGGVNLISEIDDAEALETMLLDDARRIDEAGTRSFIDFRSLLKRLSTGGSHAEAGSPAESGSLAESLRKQRERLKGL